MPLPSGFKTKEEYAAYMRKYRERERTEKMFFPMLEKLVLLRIQNKIAFPQLKSKVKKPVEANQKAKFPKQGVIVTFKANVLKPIPSRFIKNMVLKYGYLYSKEQFEETVREFPYSNITELFNVAELKKLLKQEISTANGIEFIKFYKELQNAERSLHEAGLGHVDPVVNNDMLKSRLESVALREELWMEAMDVLRAEGYHYFASKKAADNLAFHEGNLNYNDPYWYRDGNLNKHHLTYMASLSEKRFVVWSKEPGEPQRTKRQLNILVKDQEVKEVKQRKINSHLRLVRPILIQRIEAGHTDPYILRECEEKHWSRMMVEIFEGELKRLRQQGYKAKKLVAELVEEKKQS